LLCASDRESWQALRRFAFDDVLPAVQGGLSI
jgi:hypothetical protein